MDRRRFLLGLAGGGAALLGRASAQDGPAMARLRIDYEDAGRTIARDFTGLSYESAVVAANDFFTADNRTLLRLLRTLGSEGVLRIGGNTSERTLWRTQDAPAPPENFVISPFAIDRLGGFLRALRWRLIYGLNLATRTPADVAAMGPAHGRPGGLAETTPVYAGGRPRVSDRLGAALWGAELMFQIAAAGGAGINFHAGEDKVYTPISHGRGGGLTARPLYYGMLMFAQAHGDLVPARLDSGGAALVAYAVRAADGALRLVLINKDVRAALIRIEPGRRFAKGEVSRLEAPALDATAGVRFGSAAVDDYGDWAPAAREAAQFDGGVVVLDMPGASAALVTLPVT